MKYRHSRSFHLLAVLTGLAAILSGCGGPSFGILKATAEQGESRELAVSADLAFELILHVATDRGFHVTTIDASRREVRMTGRTPFPKSMADGPIHASAFVQELGPDSSRVSIVCQNSVGAQPSQDWTGKLLADVEAASRRQDTVKFGS
ncbi:MAG TPA: hypothetical protein VM223_23690 [Planctomycetota bacterium]|nr:hypothetical protein [Planctomycetota bacterium]